MFLINRDSLTGELLEFEGDLILVATDPTTARKLLLEGDIYVYIYGYISMFMDTCYV
jgi:hypothetical protein